MPFLKMSDVALAGKQLLIRVDLNVPIENGQVTSSKRIAAVLPTINMAIEQGAKVVLLSHLGRPKEGEFDPTLSLAPVASCLAQLLHKPVKFIPQLPEQLLLHTGEIALLENVRFLPGEKANSAALGKKLASLGDIFVMDAFATAHRKEASTYSVAEQAKIACAGPLLVSEIEAIQQIMQNPARPLVAIVAGAKVSTKLAILKHILRMVDCLIVGGGIANTFLAAKGYNVGKSLYEPELIPEAKELLAYAKIYHKEIPLPEDVTVAHDFSSAAQAVIKPVAEIKDELILDIGPRTIKTFTAIIRNANTVLWNGPIGVFEWQQFAEGTKALAEAIATSGAYSVAGGGDTIAAIEKYHVEKEISYISTGGGAFLECLEGKELPAIEVLKQKKDIYATN